MRGIRPVDLSSVTSAQAQELLSSARKVIEKLVYKQARRSYGYEVEDLRAVAEIAVLEAHVTYSPTARGASSRSTWTYNTIKWRLAELTTAPAGELYDHDGAHEETPEALVVKKDLGEWLERALARLPIRHGHILGRKLTGETGTEIAHTLGITKAAVSQQALLGIRRLKAQAEDDGLR